MSPKRPQPGSLLTEDWRSAALLRVGASWQEKGDEDGMARATRLYVDALARDPENTGALHNLGTLNARSKEHADWVRGVERLEAAMARLEKAEHAWVPDRLWYRVRYSLAATYAHIAAKRRTEPLFDVPKYKGALATAEALSAEVITRALSTLADRGWILQRYDDLRGFLEMVEGSAVVLLAGIWSQDISASVLPKEPPKLPVPYKEPAETRSHAGLVSALFTRLDGSAVSYRIHYNLACYYASTGEDEKAMSHLRYALERCDPLLNAWARTDPAIDPLRSKHGTQIDASIAACTATGKPKGSALSGVPIIGEKHASRLTRVGIDSPDRLALRVSSPQDRATLAAELGVEPWLVDEWARVIRFERLEGIDLDEAALLYESGLHSVETLAEWHDPYELSRLLKNVNDARGILKEAPSVQEVVDWIERARAMRFSTIIFIQ